MKFNRKDFLNAKNHIIEIDEWIAVEENDLLHHTSVKSIPDVHVTGTLEFDGMNFVSSDLRMDGTMIVLDSITNEDIFHLRRSRNKRILLFRYRMQKIRKLSW